MTATDIALPRLMREEGFRAVAYRDIYGNETIGYGFNVTAGITQRAAAALLAAQTEELNDKLASYPWYAALNPVRQSVCLDIAVNGGLHDLLNYPHMIAALERQDWETAARECQDKDPVLDASRYAPLRQLLLTGAV